MKRSLTAALIVLATTGPAVAADAPPVPPGRPVTDTFFGTAVADPYRWLEDTKAPEVAQWMKAASEQAAGTLKSITGRDKLYAEILRYDGATSARIYKVVRETGDRWFFERRGADENQFKLVMRKGLTGSDRILVDPESIAKAAGKPHAINYFGVAPGGHVVGYGLSAQGSEEAVLHLMDTRSGKPVGAPIARGNFANPGFSPDGRRMLFTRLQELKPGMPPTEKYQRAQVLLLDVGAPVARAKPVFGIGTPGVEITPAEIPFAGFTVDGRWALGFIVNGTQREFTLYVAPAAGVAAGKPQWKRLVTPADQVTGLAYHRDTLYLQTHRGAPRNQVLRAPIAGFDLARAAVVVPESQRVVTGIAAAADALYIETRDGNVKRLYKRGWTGDATVAEVKLPVEGSFQLNSDEGGNGAADARFPGLVLDLQGWNRARQVYLLGADGRTRNSGLQPQGPYDAPEGIVATEVMVKSHDGALVPMSVIHKKDVKLDGRNPTILYGYASYGITEEPFYSISRLAWLDVGGVYAIANPRGSGEFVNDWYKAGFETTKPNTW